jgi:phage baseplate assembly protein W
MYDYKANYYRDNENTTRELKDLDYVFGLHPLSSDVRKKTNIDAIKQSIKTLVLLNHYEKPFHPDVGCDVYKSLFEPFEGVFSEALMRKYIEHVINNYEPRAELDEIEFQTREDDNFFGITIWFTPENDTVSTSVDIFLRILR